MSLRHVPKSRSPSRGRPKPAQEVAVALLARRDFSAAALARRLLARGFPSQAIGEVIAVLTAQGVLNEARYAQNYVAWHVARGQGPLRIAAELRKEGLANALIEEALGEGVDWEALACKVRIGKFGARPPASWPEKARQARFLQYRGFSSDHIRAATGADPDLD